MSTAIEPTQAQQQSQDVALAKRLMFPEATEDEFRLAALVCGKYGLDPLLRHAVLIKQRARDGQPERRNLYVTRDGLLHIAHQSGKLDGIVLEKQEETPQGWRAVVSVYRKDMQRPFTYPGRYPKDGFNARYGPEMAIKVAEVMALRRAFDVALPTREEQADLEETDAAGHGSAGEASGSAPGAGSSSHPDGDRSGIEAPAPPAESRFKAIGRLNVALHTAGGLTSAGLYKRASELFGRSVKGLTDLTDAEVSQIADEIEAIGQEAKA